MHFGTKSTPEEEAPHFYARAQLPTTHTQREHAGIETYEQKSGRTNGLTAGQTDGQTDGRTAGQIDGIGFRVPRFLSFREGFFTEALG